jgi:hypothetical protein
MFVHGSLAKHTPRSCCRQPRVLHLYHQHMPRTIHLLGPVTKRYCTRTWVSSLPEHCQESMPARSSYKKIVLSTGTIYIHVVTMIELQRLVSEYRWAATLDMAPTKPLPGIRLCTGFCQIQWLVYLKQNPCHTDPLKRTLTQRASGACHGKCLKC